MICRLLPTKSNREIAQLKRKIRDLLNDIIGTRKREFDNGTKNSYGDDLLGHMFWLLKGAADQDFNLETVFGNAELFDFASQDTVANALAFSLLMLAPSASRSCSQGCP